MTQLSEACLKALDAIEKDPLVLQRETHDHVRHCPACREARVMWLAQEPTPGVLAPAGYFEQLPGRIQRKLPGRPEARRQKWLLLAAAGLLVVLAGTGGFLAGRAGERPVEGAHARPAMEVLEPIGMDAPFSVPDEDLAPLQGLNESERKVLIEHLRQQKP